MLTEWDMPVRGRYGKPGIKSVFNQPYVLMAFERM
jgi:hypothetical protein